MTDAPKYPFIQAKNFYPRKRIRVDLIVIHDMECPERLDSAESCAKYFARPDAPKASADYCVDADSIVQCVADDQTAWHTPGKRADGRYINDIAIGLEHAGYARQTEQEWNDAYSSGMLARSAKLVAELCVKHAIPVWRPSVDELQRGIRGICGHVDCTTAFGPAGGHWDPGPHFPWTLYLQMVKEEFANSALQHEPLA